MTSTSSQSVIARAQAGQAVYNKRTLSAYDFFVLGFSNRLLWKCPTPKLLDHYNQHISGNHLDVGVGTGYFLDRCRFPVKKPRIVLADMNQSSLDFAARRIARYQPQTLVQNILQPVDQILSPFDSVSINYLLHCLPGSLNPQAEASKAVIFEHLAPLMTPGATLFGATLLQGSVPRSPAAQTLMNLYNRKGIFTNQADCAQDLRAALEKVFCDVVIEIIGCAALFSARTKK